jgi:hypothetical protein
MTSPTQGADPVEIVGEVDGLATIVADLIRDNLEDGSRRALLGGPNWLVLITVVDADSNFAIEVGGGRAVISAPGHRTADLSINTDGDTLIAIPETPLWAGLPDIRTAGGRALLVKLRQHDLRISGLARHPLLLPKLLRLLSTRDAV